MTRTMFDSAAPARIPADAQMVAGYVDGHYAWSPEQWQRFDGRPRVRITVEPFNALGRPTGYTSGDFTAASVIDCETGAFSVADTARFVPARNRLHPGTATVYVDWYTLPAVLRANRAHGEHYWLWLAWYIDRAPLEADLTEVSQRLAGFNVTLAAWQHTAGRDFDTSAVLADSWHDHHKAA